MKQFVKHSPIRANENEVQDAQNLIFDILWSSKLIINRTTYMKIKKDKTRWLYATYINTTKTYSNINIRVVRGTDTHKTWIEGNIHV